MHDPKRLIGQVLADTYQLEQLLATGGMGSVYRGRHLRTAGLCAIKLLLPEAAKNSEIRARFFDEARIIASLRHPHIVHVSDFNQTHEGVPFLVMELLEGEDLEDRLRREGRLPVQQALKIARQVSVAMQAAHDRGVIHRDLKPRNLFLARHERGGTHVKIIDFGVSKIPRDHGRQTQEMLVLGTPHYSAPEAALGQNSEIDGRSDQYSLAAILYRALSGHLPLEQGEHEDLVDFLHRIGAQPVPSLSQLAPEVPPAVSQAIQRALSKRKDERFPTMLEFSSALEKLGQQNERPNPEVRAASPSLPGRGISKFVEDTVSGSKQLVHSLGNVGRMAAARITTAYPVDLGGGLRWHRIIPAALLGGALGLSILYFVSSGKKVEHVERKQTADGGQMRVAEPDAEARIRAAIGEKRLREALLLFDRLPEGPQKAELRPLRQDAWNEFLQRQLTEAEAARRTGQCRKVQEHAAQILEIDPLDSQGLSTKWRDCGTDAFVITQAWPYRHLGYPPLRIGIETEDEPVKNNAAGLDNDTEAVLLRAQKEHASKRYLQAITLANSVIGVDRLGYMTAYRLIGASACSLSKADLARYAYEHLDPPSRKFLEEQCPGVNLVVQAAAP